MVLIFTCLVSVPFADGEVSECIHVADLAGEARLVLLFRASPSFLVVEGRLLKPVVVAHLARGFREAEQVAARSSARGAAPNAQLVPAYAVRALRHLPTDVSFSHRACGANCVCRGPGMHWLAIVAQEWPSVHLALNLRRVRSAGVDAAGIVARLTVLHAGLMSLIVRVAFRATDVMFHEVAP